MTNVSSARASRSIGAIFFSVFGAVWMVLWSRRAFGWRPFILFLIALACSAIFVVALRQYSQNQRSHAAEADSPASKKAGRIFNIVNVTQWVAILIVGNVLANFGLKDWVLASAMLIIGIHFFPLAKAFDNPQLNMTGAAMVTWAIVYPLLASGGAANPVGCLGAGLILWASAIRSLNGWPLPLMSIVLFILCPSGIGQAALGSLPGNGLSQHPFLYCGEWQNQSVDGQVMYLVRGGKVVWTYSNPKKGELGDCTRLSNGNILFSRQFGASEVTPDKRIVWNYDAPPGTEIHTTYPMGAKKVLIMQNGSPAKLLVIRKRDNHVEKELILPTKSKSTHGQFRHIRPTKRGTFLVAHMDFGKVVEYSSKGSEIWSVEAPGAWAAVRLKNGNTLISGNQFSYVREVDRGGRVVWEINKSDLPDYPLYTVQEASRLNNGNTLINNWTASLPREKWAGTMQLIEVTPSKRVVWALSDWTVLGPASATQLLDEPGVPEKGDLQR